MELLLDSHVKYSHLRQTMPCYRRWDLIGLSPAICPAKWRLHGRVEAKIGAYFEVAGWWHGERIAAV